MTKGIKCACQLCIAVSLLILLKFLKYFTFFWSNKINSLNHCSLPGFDLFQLNFTVYSLRFYQIGWKLNISTCHSSVMSVGWPNLGHGVSNFSLILSKNAWPSRKLLYFVIWHNFFLHSFQGGTKGKMLKNQCIIMAIFQHISFGPPFETMKKIVV